MKRQSFLVIFVISSLVNGSFRAYSGNLLRVWAVNDHNPDLHINLAASCQGAHGLQVIVTAPRRTRRSSSVVFLSLSLSFLLPSFFIFIFL